MASPNSDVSLDVRLLIKGKPAIEGGNGGQSQPKSTQDDSSWFESIMEAGGSPEEILAESQQPKIQRVSRMLLDVETNVKCFDPLVVSIGPYHHGKPELRSMESRKTELARQHVEESGVGIETLYGKVVAVAGDARKCYAEGSTAGLDDRKFARMMFLDGCFLLRFICCSVDKKSRIKSHNIAFVRRDIFLLENQLPFIVLEALMLPDINEWWKKIDRFVQNSRARSPHDQEIGWSDWIKKIILKRNSQNPPPGEVVNEQQRPIHLLEFLRRQLITNVSPPPSSSEWSSYRSAIELKAAGIRFRPSKSSRFNDISFEPALSFGTLRLPPMMVDDSSKSMFLNLVAYESCPDAPDDFGVTSYLCFMDVLIDHAEDVKELRSSGVLLNFLGSDKEVARLFNEIGKDLVPNPLAYSKVIGDIETHYNNKAKIWIAEWLHTHFNTPWAFLAFLGAVLALALSCVQTYLDAFGDDKKKS